MVDKPGPPEGPLVVDEVFADSCKLTWKPPLDDGNAPVSGNDNVVQITPKTGIRQHQNSILCALAAGILLEPSIS